MSANQFGETWYEQAANFVIEDVQSQLDQAKAAAFQHNKPAYRRAMRNALNIIEELWPSIKNDEAAQPKSGTIASREAVDRLREAFCVITDLIEEFHDDKATLYDAAEAVMNVGLKHDEAGCYRLFFNSQKWDNATNERTNP